MLSARKIPPARAVPRPIGQNSKPITHINIGTRFGTRLRMLRVERGMTQLDMAQQFGIDRSFISDVERGRKSLSLAMIEVLAIGLKVSISELFQGL